MRSANLLVVGKPVISRRVVNNDIPTPAHVELHVSWGTTTNRGLIRWAKCKACAPPRASNRGREPTLYRASRRKATGLVASSSCQLSFDVTTRPTAGPDLIRGAPIDPVAAGRVGVRGRVSRGRCRPVAWPVVLPPLATNPPSPCPALPCHATHCCLSLGRRQGW